MRYRETTEMRSTETTEMRSIETTEMRSTETTEMRFTETAEMRSTETTQMRSTKTNPRDTSGPTHQSNHKTPDLHIVRYRSARTSTVVNHNLIKTHKD